MKKKFLIPHIVFIFGFLLFSLSAFASPASIDGTVYRSGSTPAAQISVTAIPQGANPQGSATTDAQGHFAIDNLVAGGLYQLQFSGTGFKTTFYSGGGEGPTDASQAVIVSAPYHIANFIMTPTPTDDGRGNRGQMVRGQLGRGFSNTRIDFQDDQKNVVGSTQTDADGYFSTTLGGSFMIKNLGVFGYTPYGRKFVGPLQQFVIGTGIQPGGLQPLNSGGAFNIWNGTLCQGPSGGPSREEGATGMGTPTTAIPCGLCDALIVVRNIINILTYGTLFIAVGYIVWGALNLMISGASGKLSDAQKTIWNAVKGIAVVLLSWTIINTVMHFLVSDGFKFPWQQISCPTPTVSASNNPASVTK